MLDHTLIFSIFLIFTGAAILASLALYARQPLLVAYIVLGGLVGPWGLQLVNDASVIQQIGHIGIIFLLFLLGLNLQPSQLIRMFREAMVVTLASSAIFAAIGFTLGWVLGYTLNECAILGAVMMFSSTIIGLKLLPTTALHHRHVGQVMISILLLQDIIAIIILLYIGGFAGDGIEWQSALRLALAIPTVTAIAFLLARFVLQPLMLRFDTIKEYIFLSTIGWCIGIAQLAVFAGLSYETGAFIAGVSLATSPIALYIAESLKPLRDFFLIMFFFSLGASFNLVVLPDILLPALFLGIAMLLIKPMVFARLLKRAGETGTLPAEVGTRLGQISEFSLLIAVLALNAGAIGAEVSYLIQAATLITFIVSSYVIMLTYPTPIAVSDRLRKD